MLWLRLVPGGLRSLPQNDGLHRSPPILIDLNASVTFAAYQRERDLSPWRGERDGYVPPLAVASIVTRWL